MHTVVELSRCLKELHFYRFWSKIKTRTINIKNSSLSHLPKKYSKTASSRSLQNDKYLTLHNLITKIIIWFPISQKKLNISENAWITHHLHNYSKIVNHKWKNFLFSSVVEILTVTKTRQHGCTFKMFSPQKTWLVDRWLFLPTGEYCSYGTLWKTQNSAKKALHLFKISSCRYIFSKLGYFY